MVLDSGVKIPDSPHTSLITAIERAFTLETGVSSSREWIAWEVFIRRRTQFDSVDGFCAACPCGEDTLGGVQRLAPDERDAFEARTTDFETWGRWKRPQQSKISSHSRTADCPGPGSAASVVRRPVVSCRRGRSRATGDKRLMEGPQEIHCIVDSEAPH